VKRILKAGFDREMMRKFVYLTHPPVCEDAVLLAFLGLSHITGELIQLCELRVDLCNSSIELDSGCSGCRIAIERYGLPHPVLFHGQLSGLS
jgi:hypothetical protein